MLLLFDVCSLLFVLVCCVPFDCLLNAVSRLPLYVARCSLFVVWWFGDSCLFVVRCLYFVVRCLMFVACLFLSYVFVICCCLPFRSLFVVRCSLFVVVCCLLCVVCCLLRVMCCL